MGDELNELKERMKQALDELESITSDDCDLEVFMRIQAACDLLKIEENVA